MVVCQPLLECLQRENPLSPAPKVFRQFMKICWFLDKLLFSLLEKTARRFYFLFWKTTHSPVSGLWFRQSWPHLSVLVVSMWSKPGKSSCFTLWLLWLVQEWACDPSCPIKGISFPRALTKQPWLFCWSPWEGDLFTLLVVKLIGSKPGATRDHLVTTEGEYAWWWSQHREKQHGKMVVPETYLWTFMLYGKNPPHLT